MQSMRNNKSPGIDNIPIEFYKKGGQPLMNILLHKLIRRIWVEEKGPAECKTNITVPIYKNKGHKL
jgi:hypothetical protein